MDDYRNSPTIKILEVKFEYWVPGITIGASGARENSFRDFTLEKFHDRWAVLPVKLIRLL